MVMLREKSIINELMDDFIEYPDNEDLLHGPIEGCNYVYVSNDYLNGFINYVHIISAYMIRRYSIGNDDEWNNKCKNVDLLADEKCHTNISDSSKFDDVIILAESNDCYWLFWDDCDCSDCCIGKFYKSKIDKNDIEHEFKKYVLDCIYNCLPDNELCHEDEYYIKHIPASYFRGWITL